MQLLSECAIDRVRNGLTTVEEVLRYRSPVQSMFRVTKQDVEIGGTRIPAGNCSAARRNTATAAREAGIRPIVGLEIELADACVPDPGSIVIPARRPVPHGRPGA